MIDRRVFHIRFFFFFSFREEISEVDFFNWKIWKIEDD